MLLVSQRSTETGGRDSGEPAKNIREMTLVGEPGSEADLAQADFGIPQQFSGLLQPLLQHILIGARSCRLPKEFREMKWAQSRGSGKLFEM